MSDSPWPVYARPILTPREQTLHQRLLAAFPGYIVHAQVALSQLIDAPADHPECASIRDRISQLVADFVIYRPDLSVEAVIELDDRFYEGIERRSADACKNKVLRDAGLHLVRIPAGTLPDRTELVDLIGNRSTLPQQARSDQIDPIMVIQVEGSTKETASEPRLRLGSAALNGKFVRSLLRPLVHVAAVILGAWLVYLLLQSTPAAPPGPAATAAIPVAESPAIRTTPPQQERARVISERAAKEKRAAAQSALAQQQAALAQQQAQDAKARIKEQAWEKFYAAPSSCTNPSTWLAQVYCRNKSKRARKQFEAQWRDPV